MDQRAIVARPHASYGLGIGSSLHSHYQPQQSQPQPQQLQQQTQVHPGQQPPSIPQQRPPPPINVQSPTRSFYPPSQDAPDMLEESLKRTVKIVYWYKAGHEPVRIHQEVSSYPYVRLAMFSHLVSDLGLTQNSLVDAYDADYQTWGQQHITTVQTVKAVPCLLYRARKSLLEGLADHECPGLEHELRLQHQRHAHASSPTVPSPGAVRPPKRPAPDGAADSASKHFRTASQGYVAQHPPGAGAGTPTFAAGMSAQAPAPSNAAASAAGHMHPSPASPILHSPFMQRDSALHPPGDGDLVGGGVSATVPPANGGGGSSSSPHPPLKRWPNDYAVCQIAEGFRKMDTLIRDMPSMTQRCAFEQIFGCRYVKSTVCRHRGVWKRADGALKDAFERLGPVEGALWGEFVKKTDFRREGPRAVKTQQEADDEAHAASMRVRLEYAMDGLAMDMLTGDERPPPPMASLVPPSA